MSEFKLSGGVEKALSDVDIKNILGDQAKVLIYKDLYNYNTIEELLQPEGAAVILYETNKTSGGSSFGHWTCVFNGKPVLIEGVITPCIYYFDSYGNPIDDPLHSIDPKFRIKNKEDFMYLSTLLGLCPYEVDYNDYQFQNESEGVNTCGRHCITRILHDDLDAEEYIDLFKNEPGVSSDLLVTEYTNSL
jgi:hypothetical protein